MTRLEFASHFGGVRNGGNMSHESPKLVKLLMPTDFGAGLLDSGCMARQRNAPMASEAARVPLDGRREIRGGNQGQLVTCF